MNEADYTELTARLPLRPLKNETEYDLANKLFLEIHNSIARSEGVNDYLKVLSLIICDYEETLHPVSGAEKLKDLYCASTLTQREFAKKIGVPYTTFTDVLSGRRRITVKTRKALAKHFQVREGVFV